MAETPNWAKGSDSSLFLIEMMLCFSSVPISLELLQWGSGLVFMPVVLSRLISFEPFKKPFFGTFEVSVNCFWLFAAYVPLNCLLLDFYWRQYT
jgi:hypothetical protein